MWRPAGRRTLDHKLMRFSSVRTCEESCWKEPERLEVVLVRRGHTTKKSHQEMKTSERGLWFLLVYSQKQCLWSQGSSETVNQTRIKLYHTTSVLQIKDQRVSWHLLRQHFSSHSPLVHFKPVAFTQTDSCTWAQIWLVSLNISCFHWVRHFLLTTINENMKYLFNDEDTMNFIRLLTSCLQTLPVTLLNLEKQQCKQI